jgi:hypothetical protein
VRVILLLGSATTEADEHRLKNTRTSAHTRSIRDERCRASSVNCRRPDEMAYAVLIDDALSVRHFPLILLLLDVFTKLSRYGDNFKMLRVFAYARPTERHIAIARSNRVDPQHQSRQRIE